MKKALSIILALCVILSSSSLCAPAFAQAVKDSRRYTYIAEFSSSPVLALSGNSVPDPAKTAGLLKKLNAARSAPLKKMADIVDGFSVLHSFTHTLNAVTFKATAAEAEQLKKVSGIKRVFASPKVKLIEVEPADDISSGSMIGLETLREMGLDGSGTAVAIIDGGLDVNHEALTLTDESKVKYTKDGIAAVLKANKMGSDSIKIDEVYKSAKVPFAFDYCDEDAELVDNSNAEPNHGTHVAGIAAGNGGLVKGIAPEAQVLMFKIDVYNGTTFLDNLLASIDDAAKFDIASINMSVGIGCEMPNDPAYELMSEAIDTARSNGITVCCAAGNDGFYNSSVLFPDNSTSGIPASLPGSTSIASVDNVNLSKKVHDSALESIVCEDGTKYDVYGYGYTALKPFPSSAEVVLIEAGSIFSRKEYDLDGKFALILDNSNRSYSSLVKAYKSILADSGCAGILTQVSNEEFASEIFYDLGLPLAVLEPVDAYDIKHKIPVTVSPKFGEYYAEPAEVLEASYYTSYGAGDDLSLSIDVAAPGGVIYSSVVGGYDVYSGTSMACPHITGAAALLEQYLNAEYPDLSGKEKADLKESLLMSTADPVIYKDVATSPRAVGAGLVNLPEAVGTKAILTDNSGHSALSLGYSDSSSVELTFNVRNFSSSPVTYDTVSLDIITDKAEDYREFDSDTGEYVNKPYINGESVALSYDITACSVNGAFTLQPGETKEITVTAALNEDELAANAEVFENGFFVEGYVYLTDSAGTETPLNMPFLGFYGDWFKAPALEKDEDDEFFTTCYYIHRNIKMIEVSIVNEAGEKLCTSSEEYIVKGQYIDLLEILDTSEVSGNEGKCRLIAEVTLNAPGAEEHKQVYDCCEYVIDETEPEVLDMSYTDNGDGTYDITFVFDSDDIVEIDVYGARFGNRDYFDIFTFTEPDGESDGGYTYTVKSYGQKPSALRFIIYDKGYNTTTYGISSPFAALISFFERIIAAIRNFFWMISHFSLFNF